MTNPIEKLNLTKKDAVIGAVAAVMAGVGAIAVNHLVCKDGDDCEGEPETDELDAAAADLANAQADETENHFVPTGSAVDKDQTQI